MTTKKQLLHQIRVSKHNLTEVAETQEYLCTYALALCVVGNRLAYYGLHHHDRFIVGTFARKMSVAIEANNDVTKWSVRHIKDKTDIIDDHAEILRVILKAVLDEKHVVVGITDNEEGKTGRDLVFDELVQKINPKLRKEFTTKYYAQ